MKSAILFAAALLVAAVAADSCLEFNPLEDAVLQAGDHNNGGLRPPTYGLRLWGLFSNHEYTFTFENNGANVAFVYNATDISANLIGTIVGGRDTGSSWASEYTCFINYSWTGGYIGSQLNEVHWPEGSGSGTMDCTDENGDPQPTIDLGTRLGHYIKKNHRKSYDQLGRWSVNGWVTHTGSNNARTRDFLFTLIPCCGPAPDCITVPNPPCIPGTATDGDNDGIPDDCDNCPTEYNPNQFEWIVKDYDPAGTGFWFSEDLDGRFPGVNCPLVNSGEMRWEYLDNNPVVHFTTELICGGSRTWFVDFWFLESSNGHHDDWIYYDFLEDEEVYASTIREVFANGTFGEVFYAHQNEVPPMQIGWGANERNAAFGAGGWFFYGLPGGLQYMSDFNLLLERCPDCPEGTWGLSCESECTGGASSPCSGQGDCFDGSQGDGSCSCDGGYSGPNCDSPCPAECPTTCLQNGMCPCGAGMYGPGCNQECPGGASTPCNGNGVCDDGPGGLGTCECDSDHWGDDCSGTCDAACPDTCDQTTGECFECEPGYYGADCENDCPAGHSMPCMWHGVCDGGRDGTGECTCVTGYWGNLCEQPCPSGCPSTCDPVDGTCELCGFGYYGSECDNECPTDGSGNICGGNGVCQDGQQGSGDCQCYDGYYGADCTSSCPPACPTSCNPSTGECPGFCGQTGNQYGPGCELCPGGGTCSFNGVCDWGQFGAGVCTCNAGFYGTGCENPCPANCDDSCNPDGSCPECPAGRWGPECAGVCAGGVDSPCSWAGACNDGRDGDGTCVCMDARWGVACENTCATTCHLGLCDTQTGTCNSCDEGRAGSQCELECPVTNGLVCSGHGVCNEGVTGDATCECVLGYSGYDCSASCPGGAAMPCSGNGTCVVADNSCICNPGSTGWDCSLPCNSPQCVTCELTGECLGDCLDGFAGTDCDIPCGGGAGCGPGVCEPADGTCTCPSGWTGVNCEQTVCPSINCLSCVGGSCGGNCADGYYGENCDGECPGGAATPCNNHGTCTASGECEECADGWQGADCGLPCPTGCRSCDQDDGECHGDCREGYRGDDCNTECPGGADTPCNGGGVCEDDATCTCDRHHAGDACELGCSVCAETGYCSEVSPGVATCLCNDNWLNGPQCNEPVCESQSPCIHGECLMNEAVCNCLPGYWGEQCSEECPGGADNACNNNGVCDPVDGTCTCFGAESGIDTVTCKRIVREAADSDGGSTGLIVMGSTLGLCCITGLLAALLLVRSRDELPSEKEMVFGAQESPPVTPRSKQNTPAATPRASISSAQQVVAPTPPPAPAAPEAPPPEEPPAEAPPAPAPPAAVVAAAAAAAGPAAPPPEEPPTPPPGPAVDNRATKAFEPEVAGAVDAAAVGATAAAAAAPADPTANKRLAKVTPDNVAAGLASKPAPRSFSRPKQRAGSTNSRSSRNSRNSRNGTRTPTFGHAHTGSFINATPPLSTASRPLSVGPRSSQSPSPSPRHYRSGLPVDQEFESIPTVKDAHFKKNDVVDQENRGPSQ